VRLPGVRAATYSDVPLISGRRIGFMLTVSGHTPAAGGSAGAMATSVAPNFFTAVEMPLLLGRGYTERDDAAAPKVMVVNQAFAREFFGDVQRAVGGRLSLGSGPTVSGNDIEIVGVVRDAHYTDLRDKPNPTIYPPLLQRPAMGGTAAFTLRVAGDPTAVFPAIRAAVAEIDPLLPVRDLRTQDEQLERLNAQPILFARLSGFFGVLALSLACVGLYGLMSYAVLRRTGEIGLRMALGARRGDVLVMILRESLTLVVAGVVLGLGLAAVASRLVATMLFGLSPSDPATYGTVALVLMVVALLAAFLPARRATRIDPMTALRCD
jgi:predicted permease